MKNTKKKEQVKQADKKIEDGMKYFRLSSRCDMRKN